jgi:hypothetical protein
MENKKIKHFGVYSIYNCDTFFYLKTKKETEKEIIEELNSLVGGEDITPDGFFVN